MNKFLTILFLLSFGLANADNHETCAIMLGDEIDPEEFSEVLGKKVYFCCGTCVKAFDKATAYYLKAIPELAKKFSADEQKKLGVDKVKLLDQLANLSWRIVNPENEALEYKVEKLLLVSSTERLETWENVQAFQRGHLPQYKWVVYDLRKRPHLRPFFLQKDKNTRTDTLLILSSHSLLWLTFES